MNPNLSLFPLFRSLFSNILGKNASGKMTKIPTVNTASAYFSKGHQNFQGSKGEIYEKKPQIFMCIKDKEYRWCACGKSQNQPICDEQNCKGNPKAISHVVFKEAETKNVMLCNCKQTSNRPYCDGTHARI